MCADRSKVGSGLDWKPQFLNGTQARILNLATELILPRTDTPGAQDVGVPQFIDILYGKYFNEEEKVLLTKGLAQLNSQGFQDKSSEEQTAALKALAMTESETDKAFFAKLREITLLGYFTSEEVCKNVTHYDPAPGGYVGCVPISEVGNMIMSEPR